jgi:Bacterial Ig domain
MKTPYLPLFSLLFLAACSNLSDSKPPTVAIVAPASGSPITGTVPVQITASDDVAVARVQLYARGVGATGRGVRVGSASQNPYTIQLFSPGLPNTSELELLAVANDDAGNETTSDPVRVRVNNNNLPVFSGFFAYTLPPAAVIQSTHTAVSTLAHHFGFTPARIKSNNPAASTNTTPVQRFTAPTSQATTPEFALEWTWNAFPASGLQGYGVRMSSNDLAGPYEAVTRGVQAANGNTGPQNYSKFLPAKAGDLVYGVVTPLIGNNLLEGGYSNAGVAQFLPPQDLDSPADSFSSVGGRPRLAWKAVAGATGYLYQVFDRYPTEGDEPKVWSNPDDVALAALSISYPSSKTALLPGQYYWRIIAVGFRGEKASGFSVSEVRSFTVL